MLPQCCLNVASKVLESCFWLLQSSSKGASKVLLVASKPLLRWFITASKLLQGAFGCFKGAFLFASMLLRRCFKAAFSCFKAAPKGIFNSSKVASKVLLTGSKVLLVALKLLFYCLNVASKVLQKCFWLLQSCSKGAL